MIASAANYQPGVATPFPPPGLYFTQGACTDSLDLLGQGQIGYQPYTAGGSPITSRTFSFGRAVPLVGETRTTADAKRDGLLVQDEAVDHSVELMCSNELPSVRIVGTKATTTVGGYPAQ